MNPEETVDQAADREIFEEIQIKPVRKKMVATIHFFYPEKEQNNIHNSVYLCQEWTGTPTETEEIKPKWFPLNQIPFDQMFEDFGVWLPVVLDRSINFGEFILSKDFKILDHHLAKR